MPWRSPTLFQERLSSGSYLWSIIPSVFHFLPQPLISCFVLKSFIKCSSCLKYFSINTSLKASCWDYCVHRTAHALCWNKISFLLQLSLNFIYCMCPCRFFIRTITMSTAPESVSEPLCLLRLWWADLPGRMVSKGMLNELFVEKINECCWMMNFFPLLLLWVHIRRSVLNSCNCSRINTSNENFLVLQHYMPYSTF